MFKVIVLADDFTGANDTGVQLVKHGYQTVTIIESQKIQNYKNVADAVVIDTETRALTKWEAFEATKNLAVSLKEYEGSIIYKKVDSTLRGNIGVELKALNEVLQPELIVFAPAFPKGGRTTQEGIHHINSIPIDQTELAKDPKNPVATSNIKKLLEEDLDIPIKSIYLGDIRQDLNKVIRNYVEDIKIFAFDVINEEDLRIICNNMLKLNKKVLWVGSAGLAESLMTEVKNNMRSLPTLTVAGSVSKVTRNQVKKAINPQIRLVKVDISQIFLSSSREISRVSRHCMDLISQGKDVIISSAIDDESLNISKNIAKDRKEGISKVSEEIAETLGHIVLKTINAKPVAGLILTGGDTAIHIISKLGPEGFRINTEIEQGIPEMTLLGGQFHGTSIITKAGAFGNDDSVLNAIKFMRGVRR